MRKKIYLIGIVFLIGCGFLCREAIIDTLATKFFIYSKNEVVVSLDDYESIVKEAIYRESLDANYPEGEPIKIRPLNQGDDANSYVLSKYKIRYMRIKTVDYPNNYLINSAVVYVDKNSSAPVGNAYKYSLANIVASRKYSHKIGIQFSEYNKDAFEGMLLKDNLKIIKLKK